MGVTARVRGLIHSTADGRAVRPDLVIPDDPQTDDTAASPAGNAKLESKIGRAVLGLAGPKTRIAAVMPCTVIQPGDMADRLLDRELHPEWNGERTKFIYELPTNVELWERYAEILRTPAEQGGGLAPATAFYAANRAAMDAGARVAWPERFRDGEERRPDGDEPEDPVLPGVHGGVPERPGARTFGEGAKEYNAQALAGRLSGTERYQVPREATRLTAGIDCGGNIHWYCVVAWTEQGGGTVIDYGCYPRQNRAQFAATDARPSLTDLHPGHTESQRSYAGLQDLTADVLGRTYYRDGGGEVRVEKALVDRAGNFTAPVYQFVRASDHQGVLLPSKGVGRTTTRRGGRVEAAAGGAGRLSLAAVAAGEGAAAGRSSSTPTRTSRSSSSG
jgi:hypothetical protein